MIYRENITIPVNPRTHRHVGYAFVTLSTSFEADRVISQLSGKEILERKTSIQRARAEEMKTLDTGTTSAEEGTFVTSDERMGGYRGDGNVEAEEEHEEDTAHEISRSVTPQDMQAAPPMSWNTVNTTKIRTTFKEGKSPANSAERLDQQPSPAHTEGSDSQGNIQMSTDTDLKQTQTLGQFPH